MTEPTDDEVFTRMEALAPLCQCGRRLKLGGVPPVRPLLVCPSCSSVSAATPEFCAHLEQHARTSLEAQQS